MELPALARDTAQFQRRCAGFVNARTAFGAFLSSLDIAPDQVVLLPGYVGWSAREGSGVLDPVVSLGLRHRFYRLHPDLTIDLADLSRRLNEDAAAVVVIIHYFGHCDPGYAEAVGRARAAGAAVLEDEAHAMLTDLCAGLSGRLGDAAIFSLHKLLPTPVGGVLVANGTRPWLEGALAQGDHSLAALTSYDLSGITQRRRANAAAWSESLDRLGGLARPLWPAFGTDAEVPQTYPVVLRGGRRDEVYQRANAAGIGVVSLYHTLVDAISPADHPASHALSRHILNLPVHQGIAPRDIPEAAEQLAGILDALDDEPEPSFR